MAAAKRNHMMLRPTPRDKAAIDVLSEKLGISVSNVIRLAIHRMADLEGVQGQVATKLESTASSEVLGG